MIKKILPHLIALAAFAAVSMAFFYPQYQGKALRQSDMVQFGGMAVDLNQHIEQYGEHPMWLGRMFGGGPSYATSLDHSGRYIGNNMHWLNVLGQPASMIFLTMAGFYLMLLMFGVNPWLAMVGGLAYGLSTYFPIIISAGHITKMWALQWVAPMIGSIWWAYRKNRWTGAALTALFGSLELAAYHPQITYYFLFVVAGLLINEVVRSVKEKSVKQFAGTTAALLGAAVLAVGSNFTALYFTAQLSKDSIRGASELTAASLGDKAAAAQSAGLDKDYATQWSYGIGETFNLFIPNLYGGGREFEKGGAVDQALKPYAVAGQVPADYYSYMPSYHGDQPFTEGPVYVGAVVVFLALFGALVLRGAQKWWVLGPMFLAILLAWGHNLMWFSDLFLDYFPMYNKFRTVSMILVVVEWALPFLAFFGLWQALTADRKSVLKALTVSAGVAGGVALVAALVLPSTMDFLTANEAQMPQDIASALIAERSAMLSVDAWRTLAFVALAAGLLWLFFKDKIKAVWLYVGLGALVVFDMYGVDRRYVAPDDFMPVRQATEVAPSAEDLQILQDTTNYRVANFKGGNNPFAEARTSRFHRSVGGYSAAKLRRYQELIDRHLSKMNMAAYDMLNAKYFITDQGVQLNDGALGNGWFVDTVRIVSSADEEITALDTIDPATTAAIDRRFKTEAYAEAPDSTAAVELTDYRVDRLVYRTRSASDRLALFSEIYYPGWQVEIDCTPAEALRANYVLRAAEVPAGEHTVVWTFRPEGRAAAVAVTRWSSILLLLSLVGAAAWAEIKRRKTNEGTNQ